MTVPTQFANQAGPLLLSDLDADFAAFQGATGAALVSDTLSASGAVKRTQSSKNADTRTVKDFGAVGDGTADDSASMQAAITVGGGSYRIPAGTYRLVSGLTFDYSSISFPDYLTPSVRASLYGDSLHGTILKYAGSVSSFAITFTGPTSIANLGVYQQGRYQDFVLQDSGLTKTRHGITITNQRTAEFRRLNVSGFDHGMLVNSSLLLKFDNVAWTLNNIGLVIDNTTGQANPNACSWDNCDWQANVHQAIIANLIGTANRFTSCNIGSNGTQGTAGDGGVFLNINPSNGPAGVSVESCYFEGNGGGADLYLTNIGTQDVTCIVKGCTFNRVSSSKYVTNNIVGSNTGGGKLRIVLIGCAFFSSGTYVPNAGRPFMALTDTAVQFIDGGGNTFSETTSDVLDFAGSPGLSANFDSVGGTVSAPSGVTCAKNSTGNYTVSSVVPFGKAAADYSVQITPHVPFTASAVYQRVNTTSFTVSTFTPSTGAAVDADFSIVVHRIK